ncbi:MAG: SusD/RagB family nutrient-binding outer membrane lipoprotein [Ferruginibacter sp.]
MKYKFVKSLFALSIGIALIGTGCKKLEDFGDTDVRSDASLNPITSNLLTNAQVPIANLFASVNAGIRGELYAQHWSETQYTDVSLYGNPQLDFGSYSTGLYDLQTIINLNTDVATKSTFNVYGTAITPLGSNGSQIAIATILKVYYLWTITDRWGDVPYSEALQGTVNSFPVFDKQEDIYPRMLADLKGAIASFDNTGAAVRGDIYFPVPTAPAVATQANVDKQILSWTKVANSLRMLIALRMSKVYPSAGGLAATEFADAAAQPAIETNAENWVMMYPGGTALQTNVFYSALNGRKDYAFSQTLGDILSNMSDPRINAYSAPGTAFPYGLPRDQAVAFDGSVSGAYAKPFNPSFISPTSSIVIIPASYVLLAKAEAVERGWITGVAQDYYESGVNSSFAQWGQGSAAGYLAGQANYNTGAGGGSNIGFNSAYPSIVGADANTSTPLQRIQLQKYIATFGDGIQAWSEWRRTGVPNLKPTAFGTNSPKEIPRRLTYGTGEYGTNPTEVANAAAALTGGDVMNARMWWDQ